MISNYDYYRNKPELMMNRGRRNVHSISARSFPALCSAINFNMNIPPSPVHHYANR